MIIFTGITSLIISILYLFDKVKIEGIFKILKAFDLQPNADKIVSLINNFLSLNFPQDSYTQIIPIAGAIIGIIALLYIFEYLKYWGVWVYNPTVKENRYFSILLMLPNLFLVFVLPPLV
jgi:hypothetical protein